MREATVFGSFIFRLLFFWLIVLPFLVVPVARWFGWL